MPTEFQTQMSMERTRMMQNQRMAKEQAERNSKGVSEGMDKKMESAENSVDATSKGEAKAGNDVQEMKKADGKNTEEVKKDIEVFEKNDCEGNDVEGLERHDCKHDDRQECCGGCNEGRCCKEVERCRESGCGSQIWLLILILFLFKDNC